ncbi:amidohydrolase family protein [Aquisalibacillus elongatus]|uniref:Amidohydrolase family protein n=1 Tax=Aquisalibacillus elongatus TaxID=485577 RepID=A0A3N5B0D2_9BACI|nr:amidohydrolase family protein [Aquisalibacillus elongatus]RPF50673.1 amidohydrolase family protein [Aquisalibacillus elongatus]
MSLLLKNGKVINVETGEVEESSILIQQDQIVNVGNLDEEADDVIDLDGKYVIPGLIDMHCHIKERFAHLFTAAGVTTVRNTAGNVMELRDMIEAPNNAQTPRIYSADRLIDGPPGLWGPTSPYSFNASEPDEARLEVQRQANAGAQFIKVYGWLSPEIMKVVVDESHKHGLEVSCDLIHSSKVNALQAAQMGVKWFEHNSGVIQAIYPGWFPSTDQDFLIDWEQPDLEKLQEVCQQLLKHDVYMCPTTVVFDQANHASSHWNSDERFSDDSLRNIWDQMSQYKDELKDQLGIQTEYLKAITKTYYDLGGTIVAGTDTPGGVWTYPGMALHRELELLVESGLTPFQALQCATTTAARSINKDEIGVVSTGKIADLLVLNSNPLDDIRYTKDIDTIIKGGAVYNQEKLLNYKLDEDLSDQKLDAFIQEFEQSLSC